MVSSVLQIIDIPQLKLSTFTGGGRNSDAEEQPPLQWSGFRSSPNSPLLTAHDQSRSASPCNWQRPGRAGNGINGA